MFKKMVALIIAGCVIGNASVCAARPLSVSYQRMQQQRIDVPSKMYRRKNIELLAKIIQHEAGNTASDTTSLLVGIVVMKRVKSELFPNSIKKVLLQDNPRQYLDEAALMKVSPNERSYEIAEELLRKGQKGIKEYPDNLLYHANFIQGQVYMYSEGIYFCLRR